MNYTLTITSRLLSRSLLQAPIFKNSVEGGFSFSLLFKLVLVDS